MTDLEKPRFLAHCALLMEAVWPPLWPPLGVGGLFLCAALLDLPPLLPAWAHVGLLAATGVVVLGLLYHGLRRIRLPDRAEVDRRLEAASGLSHRPLAVLSDTPAPMDGTELALWEAHRAQAASQIKGLRVGIPRPGLSRHDPQALRAAVILALVVCFTVAGRDAPGRILAALQPHFTVSVHAVATPELRAWITPPTYTRLPPIFLRAETLVVSAPDGSHLTVSLTGASGAPALSVAGAQEPFKALDSASFQAERELTASGRVDVLAGGATLGHWDVTVVADQPPSVAWNAPPGRAQGSQQTRLPWKAEDDYGVVSLRAALRLAARPDAPAFVVAIPLPGSGAKSAKGVNQQDLTAHPWAGLAVVATLVGQDFPGQTGTSEPATFELPERPFQNPVALALIQVRKGLSLHPGDFGDEMEILDGLLQKPEVFGDDLSAVLNLSGIYHKLVRDPSLDGVAEAQERLWQLALHLEEGQLESSARALDEARDAAREALEALLKEPSQTNRDALDAQLQALQEAIDRHLQALMDEAHRNGDPPPLTPEQKARVEQEMRRLTDQTRDAAKNGTPKDAEQRMAELERKLDQLRNAKPGQQNQRNAEQRQRGRQQMGAVQDMVGREGGLLDHTESRVGQPMKPRSNQNGSNQNGADPNAAREADRRVQQALRRSLGELMQQFGDLTGEVPPSLSEADRAMREAGTAMGQGRDKEAGDSVQQAIEALQKGAQEMGQAMAKKFGPPQPGSGEGEGEGDENLFGMTMPGGQQTGRGDGPLLREPGRADSRGRDPLGRQTGNGTSGGDESDDAIVPEERERQKTLAIQEELRRRGAERGRPQPELDYIERLLKQF